MYVTSADLRAVRREGVLTRFAVLGPVAFVLADLPDGTRDTSFEAPCGEQHWGIVLRGTLRLVASDEVQLPAGAAFHVPAGKPEHRFCSDEPVVLAGFTPLTAEYDTSDEALVATGFEIVRGASYPPPPLPATITLSHPGSSYCSVRGAIGVETERMGPWLFTRAEFGPLSGYTSGWCDLPHWGLVVQGDLAIAYEHGVEILGAGDAYYCPPGPPGHRFEVPDSAVLIDYTPIEESRAVRRRAEWRRMSTQPRGRAAGTAVAASPWITAGSAAPPESTAATSRRVRALAHFLPDLAHLPDGHDLAP